MSRHLPNLWTIYQDSVYKEPLDPTGTQHSECELAFMSGGYAILTLLMTQPERNAAEDGQVAELSALLDEFNAFFELKMKGPKI